MYVMMRGKYYPYFTQNPEEAIGSTTDQRAHIFSGKNNSILVSVLITQAPIRVCLDGTVIDSRTILVTMYYCGYVGV